MIADRIVVIILAIALLVKCLLGYSIIKDRTDKQNKNYQWYDILSFGENIIFLLLLIYVWKNGLIENFMG